MNDVLRVKLTGRAARFLDMLREFGHVDEEHLDEIYVALAEMSGSAEEALVDLPDVRRMAAAVLFDPGDAEAVEALEKGVLAEDWPILFS